MQTLELESAIIDAVWDAPNQLRLEVSTRSGSATKVVLSKKGLHDLMAFLLSMSRAEPKPAAICAKGKAVTEDLLECREYRNRFTEEPSDGQKVKCKTCLFCASPIKVSCQGECSNPAARLDGKTSVESDDGCDHGDGQTCGECSWFKK